VWGLREERLKVATWGTHPTRTIDGSARITKVLRGFLGSYGARSRPHALQKEPKPPNYVHL